jgi:hypothetical protein
MLRNYSEEGALLKFSQAPSVPEVVELVINNCETLVPAHVRWRRGELIGVQFPPGCLVAELREQAAFTVPKIGGSSEAVH